jgi:D-alanyl-D-alanine carboxypeptidase
LYEEGKLQLEDKITNYLSADVLKDIENAQQATVGQLLQHSSGIYNYIQNAKFQTASLNDLKKVWQPNELLKYARNEKAYFAPGTNVTYSNTGYILLGMIIEKIEGKPFYEVFKQKIFTPLGLKNTRFAATNPVPAGLVQGYADLYSNFNVINSTYYSGWDYYTADGGLISNPYDMALFIEKLFNGQILSQATLNKMLNWQTPKETASDFYPIHYGLGIFKIETQHGTAYMHSGDAIGYYATMLYFPAQQTTVVWAVNGNYGKLDEFSSTKNAYDKVLNTVF